MKLHVWQREHRIAHLSVHGWEPVREIPSADNGYGVFNPMLGYGLRVLGTPVPNAAVRRIDATRMVPAQWDNLPDRTLILLVKTVDSGGVP